MREREGDKERRGDEEHHQPTLTLTTPTKQATTSDKDKDREGRDIQQEEKAAQLSIKPS